MRWFPASCALAMIACASPGERLALPPTEGGRALIWMVGDGARPRIFAIDLAAGFEPSDLAVGIDGDAEIHAVVYPGTLASMQLVPGELVLDPAGLPLPQPLGTHVWRRAYAAGVASAWIELTERPPAFDELLILRRSPCGSFVLGDQHSLASGLRVMQEVLRFSDDRVVFAASTDHHDPASLLPLQAEGLGGSVGLIPFAPLDSWSANEVDRAYVSGTRTSSSGPELWRVDVRGQRIGTVPVPLVTTATGGAPRPAALYALATAGDVIFALSQRSLHRWDGAAWETLFTIAEGDVEGVNHQVFALSADEAIFTHRAGSTVGWYRRGQGVTTFPFDPHSPLANLSTETVRTTLAHPQAGPILSTKTGNFYALDAWPPSAAPTWQSLGSAGTASAGVMVPFPGGFLAGGINAFLVEFHFGFGFCPVASLPGINVYHLANLGGDAWLGSGTAHMAPTTNVRLFRWIRP